MKKIVAIVFLSTLFFFCSNLFSQEPCKVLMQSISDSYVGKCKKGLAHGKGIAEGVDKYEGRFKNGLPEGYGKYTWSNGVVFEGFWVKGKRDGDGKLFFNVNGVDSIRIGVWKNDMFVRKKILNPYSVLRSNNIARYSVRRIGDGEKVMLSIYQNGVINGSASITFFYSSSGNTYSIGPKQGFERVEFPVTLKISYNSFNPMHTARIICEFEIVIKERGDWEIELNN